MLDGIDTHDKSPDGRDPDRVSTVRSAATYVGSVFGFAIAFAVLAAALYDPVPMWVLIVFPLLIFVGAIGALWRTYRMWQAQPSTATGSRGPWQVWQGASWILLFFFLLTLTGAGGAFLQR